MENRFSIHWVLLGMGAVVVGKIVAAALSKYAGISL